MWMADSDRYNEMRNQLESMQTSCEACVVELMECLESLLKSLVSQADRFLGHSQSLAAQSRAAIKEERKKTLLQLDELQREMELLNLNNTQLQTQIKGLEDDRRELKSRIGRMVPRSDLIAMAQEAGVKANNTFALERENAKNRETIKDLIDCIFTLEEDKSKLQSLVQARSFTLILIRGKTSS
jgi:vacuolar-type H+-ATPase subunit I/STV1